MPCTRKRAEAQIMNREAGEGKMVLCGASAYEKKYYFNEKFAGLPASVKDELHIICVLFTEEIGGVFMQVLEDAGVYKRTEEGQAAFDRFMASLNG